MQLFFAPDLPDTTELPPEEAQHAVKVLRMRAGDTLWATDGRGTRYETRLVEAMPKRCRVSVLAATPTQKSRPQLHLAIAPTKNLDRMEWLLEKAVEIGVAEVVFLYTEHSERKVLKLERLQRKVLSAVKQSLKDWVPPLQELTPLPTWLEAFPKDATAYVAHLAGPETPHLYTKLQAHTPTWVLVGPEGGFSEAEVEQMVAKGIQPALLGQERLRTETAGLAAAQLVALRNELG